MARLYTEQDINKVLKKLRIDPDENRRVDGNEAAMILTWRAKDECKVEYQYDATAVRQHVRKGNFPEGSVTIKDTRHNLYQLEAVFKLPISPRRGAARRRPISQTP